MSIDVTTREGRAELRRMAGLGYLITDVVGTSGVLTLLTLADAADELRAALADMVKINNENIDAANADLAAARADAQRRLELLKRIDKLEWVADQIIFPGSTMHLGNAEIAAEVAAAEKGKS